MSQAGYCREPLSLLGLMYDPGQDTLRVKVSFNLLKKNRGEKGSSRLISSAEDVKNELSKGLTKRDLISLVHSLFDPIQAFLPISSQMKIIYRDLLAACPQMKWDDKIPENFKSRIEAILMLYL